MIEMRSLAKGNLGQETVLKLGLAIFRDPTTENLLQIWRVSRANSSAIVDQKIEVFGWLDC